MKELIRGLRQNLSRNDPQHRTLDCLDVTLRRLADQIQANFVQIRRVGVLTVKYGNYSGLGQSRLSDGDGTALTPHCTAHRREYEISQIYLYSWPSCPFSRTFLLINQTEISIPIDFQFETEISISIDGFQ